MSDVTLSSAVRSNLLSLQTTADMMSKTQERLATGLKVNSALDNPTNFFTASALNSRASDLARLLDGVSNATQTLEAADNGISAITKLVESAQATARQALQTPATIDVVGAASAGTVNAGAFSSLDITGGSTPASEGGATAAGAFNAITFTDETSGTASFAFAAADFDEAADTISFDIDIDGTSQSITIDKTIADAASVGNDGNLDTIAEFQGALDAALQAGGFAGSDYTLSNDGTNITITAAGSGAGSVVNITNNANNNETGGAGAFTNAGLDAATEVDGVAGDVLSFDVDVDGTNQTFSFTAAEVNAELSSLTVSSVDDLAQLINTKLTGATASNASGSLRLESATTGVLSDVDVNSVTFNDNGAGAVATNDTGFNGTTGQDGTAGAAAGAATDSLSFTIAVDGGAAQTVTLDEATVTAYNSANSTSFDASALTADNVAALINDQITGATAAVDATSGNLTFTSDTTGAASSVTLTAQTGTAASGSTGVAVGTNTGAAQTTTTSTNAARSAFVDQYNELLSQIDELAEDAGFNGVNLLDGDDLSVIFNEDGSSNLDIAGVSFDSTGLGLSQLASTGLDTDAGINSVLGNLDTAINSLRSQASEFGSNLSVVETRENFTKAMINTLETGAANLTLADTNEEGANLLALQTRQQLSSTALSLASQADQNVLRLF